MRQTTSDNPIQETTRLTERSRCRVQPGDLWQLGKHRILCGDSTDRSQVEFLLQGERARLTITSPPYNLGVSRFPNSRKGASKYLNHADALPTSEYLRLLVLATENALAVSEVVIVNLQMLGANKIAIIEYLHHFRDRFVDVVVWDKQRSRPVLAKNVLNSRFEILLFFTNRLSKGKTPRTIFTADFRGTVDNVYQGTPQRHNSYFRLHAATFPFHLPLWLMQTFDSEAGIVFDSFLGTGTTLLAAEQLGRRCFGIEIEPAYCDLILQRFEEATGIRPARGIEGKNGYLGSCTGGL